MPCSSKYRRQTAKAWIIYGKICANMQIQYNSYNMCDCSTEKPDSISIWYQVRISHCEMQGASIYDSARSIQTAQRQGTAMHQASVRSETERIWIPWTNWWLVERSLIQKPRHRWRDVHERSRKGRRYHIQNHIHNLCRRCHCSH